MSSLLALDILFPGAITLTKLALGKALDAVISELLKTAPAYVDKHIIMTFVVFVRSIESLDIDFGQSLVCSWRTP